MDPTLLNIPGESAQTLTIRPTLTSPPTNSASISFIASPTLDKEQLLQSPRDKNDKHDKRKAREAISPPNGPTSKLRVIDSNKGDNTQSILSRCAENIKSFAKHPTPQPPPQNDNISHQVSDTPQADLNDAQQLREFVLEINQDAKARDRVVTQIHEDIRKFNERMTLYNNNIKDLTTNMQSYDNHKSRSDNQLVTICENLKKSDQRQLKLTNMTERVASDMLEAQKQISDFEAQTAHNNSRIVDLQQQQMGINDNVNQLQHRFANLQQTGAADVNVNFQIEEAVAPLRAEIANLQNKCQENQKIAKETRNAAFQCNVNIANISTTERSNVHQKIEVLFRQLQIPPHFKKTIQAARVSALHNKTGRIKLTFATPAAAASFARTTSSALATAARNRTKLSPSIASATIYQALPDEYHNQVKILSQKGKIKKQSHAISHFKVEFSLTLQIPMLVIFKRYRSNERAYLTNNPDNLDELVHITEEVTQNLPGQMVDQFFRPQQTQQHQRQGRRSRQPSGTRSISPVSSHTSNMSTENNRPIPNLGARPRINQHDTQHQQHEADTTPWDSDSHNQGTRNHTHDRQHNTPAGNEDRSRSTSGNRQGGRNNSGNRREYPRHHRR